MLLKPLIYEQKFTLLVVKVYYYLIHLGSIIGNYRRCITFYFSDQFNYKKGKYFALTNII